VKLRKLANFVTIVLGAALAIYGASLLIGFPNIFLGKFSADAFDTNSALLITLIGVALALYGWLDPGPGKITGSSSADEP
jgi:Ca2+/H+ antiporter